MLIKYFSDRSEDCPLIMPQGGEPEVVARVRTVFGAPLKILEKRKSAAETDQSLAALIT